MVVKQGFFSERKVVRFKRVIGCEMPILRLWSFCESQKRWKFPTSELDAEELVDICELESSPQELLGCLLKGFMEERDGNYVVTSFEETQKQLIGLWKGSDVSREKRAREREAKQGSDGSGKEGQGEDGYGKDGEGISEGGYGKVGLGKDQKAAQKDNQKDDGCTKLTESDFVGSNGIGSCNDDGLLDDVNKIFGPHLG